MADTAEFNYRLATLEDLDNLVAIETVCFDQDRLSKRSMRRWIQSEHGILLLLEQANELLGYGLVWRLKGTRLSRLYSLAVSPKLRGQGLAKKLLVRLEQLAAESGCFYMRLEVAENNTSALKLYESCDYRIFGEYSDYYEDHSDALRMQKKIQRMADNQVQRQTPWYPQSTEFTCGPAALMMAMGSLDSGYDMSLTSELDIWREATTIFMTSGHGGCHPVGLALAAGARGFLAQVYLNTDQALFIDGVRSESKKHIMSVVHNQFVAKAQASDVTLVYQDISQQQVVDWLQQGYAVLILISTFRLDGKKAPHWVTVTGIDDRCLYVHDPDWGDPSQLALDCQHLPIAREDFDKMSAFGSGRLRTAVAIKASH